MESHFEGKAHLRNTFLTAVKFKQETLKKLVRNYAKENLDNVNVDQIEVKLLVGIFDVQVSLYLRHTFEVNQ